MWSAKYGDLLTMVVVVGCSSTKMGRKLYTGWQLTVSMTPMSFYLDSEICFLDVLINIMHDFLRSGGSDTFIVLLGVSRHGLLQKVRSHYRHFHKELVCTVFQIDGCVCKLEKHCKYGRCFSCPELVKWEDNASGDKYIQPQ